VLCCYGTSQFGLPKRMEWKFVFEEKLKIRRKNCNFYQEFQWYTRQDLIIRSIHVYLTEEKTPPIIFRIIANLPKILHGLYTFPIGPQVLGYAPCRRDLTSIYLFETNNLNFYRTILVSVSLSYWYPQLFFDVIIITHDKSR
jgi:hypothetical protein